MKVLRGGAVAVLVCLIGCASAPHAPDSGKATLWGHLRIVPHKGVKPIKNVSGPYSNPRLRDVTFVDYTRPGFAVVYLEGDPPSAETLHIGLEASRLGARLEPSKGAVGLGGKIFLRNDTGESHLVSCPEVGFLRRLAPGAEVSIDARRPGSHGIFVLDASGVSATFFVAPGPYAVVGADGRWEIPGVSPGLKKLHAWHPRFPPSLRQVEAPADRITEVNLELAVDEPARM